jgi:exosortase D (VPLPA-CTERM-specific)
MSLPRLSQVPVRALVQVLLIVSGLAVAYRSVVPQLVESWSYDENYSHGYLIVPIAAYLAWERRHRFMSVPSRATNWGLLVIAGSLLVLATGVLGIDLFLTRVSLIGAVAGIVLFFFGWQRLRVMAFPLAFLILMVPLPAIVFNQISFPLQLVASQFGEMLVRAAGIDVTRDGNVIVLENITLQVAEACSGIRSLVSLLTLGLVFANVADARMWMRMAIAASTVPTAIVANGFRIAGTAVASHHYGAKAAEGFFHDFSGWLLFGVAVAGVLLLHRTLLLFAPDRTQAHGVVASAPRSADASSGTQSAGILGAATVFSLLIAGSVLIARAETIDRIPARRPLAALPAAMGDWRGYDDPPLADDVETLLNADDLLMRTYFAPDGRAAGLYIGYWETQRRGDAVHSPLICLPGAGWQPLSKRLVGIDADASEKTPATQVNRYVIQRGSERLLVLYWYQAHGRIVANEYARKFYLVADAVRMRRSDSAIVRIITPIASADPAAEARAERAASDFARRVLRDLDAYIPL